MNFTINLETLYIILATIALSYYAGVVYGALSVIR